MKRNEVKKEYTIDLKQLYKTTKDFNLDCDLVLRKIKDIEKFKNKVTKSAQNLYDVLELCFKTHIILEKLGVYSGLLSEIDASDVNGKNAYAKLKGVSTTFEGATAFVDDEILNCNWETIKKYISENKDLKLYEFYLTKLFKKKKHILSEKEEILLSQMNAMADEIENNRSIFFFEDLKFGKVKDENGHSIEVTNQNYKKLLENNNRKFRRRVFNTYNKSFASFQSTFAALLNSKLNYDLNEAKIRNYDSPLAMSLSSYDLDEKVITNYLKAANKYKNLNRKFNNSLKKVLKFKTLYTYDLSFNPFPVSDKSYSIEEAKIMLFKSFSIYGDEYQKYLKEIFDERRVDYLPTDNKSIGAFCTHGYKTNSYVFLNYQDKIRDISTLAHELGHALHAMISDNSNHHATSRSSFLLVEIASVINEILFCEYVLENSDDIYEKYELLKSLLDTLLGNFFVVAGRLEIQNKMYEKIKDGQALSADFINEATLEVLEKFECNGIKLHEDNKYLWMRVAHYYYLYYNYQYAIGVGIACLFALKILSGDKNEVENYLEFLKACGRDFPIQTLKKYGVDLLDENVFSGLMDYIDIKLSEFEKIINQIESDKR